MQVTLITSGHGPLTKSIELGQDGELVSKPAANLLHGKAEHVEAATASALAEIIRSCRSDQALALGSIAKDVKLPVDVVTKANKREGAITRTRDCIDYRAGPAWMALDHDRKGMPRAMAEELELVGAWAAMVRAAPDLEKPARVSRASTSAGIREELSGHEYPGSGGEHHYIAVRDGTDIDRALQVLHERLWLAGFGWYMLGKGGQLLERSAVDVAVRFGERLVFEGPPQLGEGLEQDEAAREPRAVEGVWLDTAEAIPDLTPQEKARVERLKAEARGAMEAEAKAARGKHDETLARRWAKKHNIGIDRARHQVAKWHDGVLSALHELEMDDGQVISVGDVLKDPERWIGETLADPIEGVSYGRCKAKIMDGDEGPFIHSFAHGGGVYRLAHTIESASDYVRASKAPIDAMIAAVLQGGLEADEEETLVKLAAAQSGEGLRALGKRLAQAKAREKRKRAMRKVAAQANGRQLMACPQTDDEVEAVARKIEGHLLAKEQLLPPARNAEGRLVTVTVRPAFDGFHELVSEDHEGERMPPPPEPVITQLNDQQVTMLVERHVALYETNGEPKLVALPLAHVKGLASLHDSALPLLLHVNTSPLILEGGVVQAPEGLQEDGVYHDIAPDLRDCLWPETPGEDDVREALGLLLDDLLGDVATDETGKMLILAHLVTLLQRALLPERPAWVYTASTRGSGKTTVVNMVTSVGLGRKAAAASWSREEEERKKALFAAGRAGQASLSFDNVPRGDALKCASLEAALTSKTIEDRVLGESRRETAPMTTVISFTGNAIVPIGDMAARSVVVKLACDRPDPENRSFKIEDIFGWIGKNRARLMRAVFCVMQYGAAQPIKGDGKTRFKTWWRLCGHPLEQAARLRGIELDFNAVFAANDDTDEEAVGVFAVATALHAVYEERDFTAADVAGSLNHPLTDEEEALRSVLVDGLWGKEIGTKVIGKRLKNDVVGRVLEVGGGSIKLVARLDGHTKVNSFRFEVRRR